MTDGLSNNTVYAYDGLDRRVSVTDPLGRRTQYAFDTTGTLRNVIDAKDQWTTHTYDFYQRLVKFTDQRGNSTEYAFDEEGRLVSEKNPLNQVTRMGYVEAGCGSCGATYGVGKV